MTLGQTFLACQYVNENVSGCGGAFSV